MVTKQELAPKYIEIYNLIRDQVKDEDVYPEKTDTEITNLIRATSDDWFPVPSFGMTEKDIKKSDMAHISIRVRDNKVIADLFFNGEKPVSRFLNILNSKFEEEKKEFFHSVTNLGKEYTISVKYALKGILAPADWEDVTPLVKCYGLTEEEVENILKIIDETKNKRDLEQKKWGKRKTATLAISLAKVETEKNDNSKIKEAFTNLAKLTRIAHRIKSNKEIKRQIRKQKYRDEKELPKKYKERDNLRKEISGDESFGISQGLTTKEAVDKKKEELRKIEDKIKDIEKSRVSEYAPK
jgi:hypothetical protein